MALKQILGELNANGVLCVLTQPQINEGENGAVHLTVKIDKELMSEVFATGDVHIEFQCVDGKKYVSSKVDLVNDVIDYPIENAVLRGDGEIEVQIVARDRMTNLIFKSQKVKFRVDGSINAEILVSYREDFLTKMQNFLIDANDLLDSVEVDQEVVAALRQQMSELISKIEQDRDEGLFNGKQGMQGIKGEQGDQGIRGERGLQGEKGLTGEKGDQGETGSQGNEGLQGEKGLKGEQGIKGDKGDQGETGSQGNQGVQGAKGDRGEKGETGNQGERGFQGDKGAMGLTGVQGVQGLDGERGIQGEKGLNGLKGDRGDKGEVGEQGVQGVQGAQGGMGISGLQGVQGERGETGEQGAQGERGFQGTRGDTGFLTWGDEGAVSSGTITWEVVGG